MQAQITRFSRITADRPSEDQSAGGIKQFHSTKEDIARCDYEVGIHRSHSLASIADERSADRILGGARNQPRTSWRWSKRTRSGGTPSFRAIARGCQCGERLETFSASCVASRNTHLCCVCGIMGWWRTGVQHLEVGLSGSRHRSGTGRIWSPIGPSLS